MRPDFLMPFWSYYGAKWKITPKYPTPMHHVIIEPFAGAAGYSLRYYDRQIILVEKYPVLAELWRYLIRVSASEIRAIPYVESVDDLPSWVPEGGQTLVGFYMNYAVTAPRKTLSSSKKKAGKGWTDAVKNRIASQIDFIRHWIVVEGDYTRAPNIEATWYVDPPYQNAGKYYIHGSGSLDFGALGDWCRSRRGQVIVCENAGADWLPFRHLFDLRGAYRKNTEVIWTNDIAQKLHDADLADATVPHDDDENHRAHRTRSPLRYTR